MTTTLLIAYIITGIGFAIWFSGTPRGKNLTSYQVVITTVVFVFFWLPVAIAAFVAGVFCGFKRSKPIVKSKKTIH